MSTFDLHVTSPPTLGELYAGEAPQKDHLCGAFWGALALRSAGISSFGSEPVDQDLVAWEARTTLEEGDPYASLPPGASPRLDYRLPIPVAADPSVSGTSANSLRQAIIRCSEEALAVLPIAGPWTEESLVSLFRVVDEETGGGDCLLIANLQTGSLWGSRTNLWHLLSYLRGTSAEGLPSEWDVGHFVAVVFAIVRGPRAVAGVLDTYPSFGWKGLHLQPAEALASALRRDDDREGGILCVSWSNTSELEMRLRGSGFELRDWDNGSVAD